MTLKFQLPIETVNDEIDSITFKDLEILETKQTNQTSEANKKKVKRQLTKVKIIARIMMKKLVVCLIIILQMKLTILIKESLMKYYTTDISFLTQTQEFIKNSKSFEHISRDLLISSRLIHL